MENLNALEVALLKSIIEENSDNYSFLLSHLSILRVKNREFTGVGFYSNFEYLKPVKEEAINALLSSKKQLLIPGLKNELSYVLSITNGQINHIEISTNGNEEWNGNSGKFELK